MGNKDIGLKAYLRDTVRYADLWNGGVFQGRQMVKADELQEITPVHSKSDKEARCRIRMPQGIKSCSIFLYTEKHERRISDEL